MNDDYCMEGIANATIERASWLRKLNPRSYARRNARFFIFIIIIVFIFITYWRYIRPKWYKKIHKKLSHFEWFKYSHLTNQGGASQEGEALTQSVRNTNCHMLIYGSSASGKTSFLKHYRTQIAELRKRSYVVFGQDENEFPASNFVPLLQLEKIGIESLANKTVILDDAGAYKSLKTKVEDLFRFGRHQGIQVIYLAHYAKDVLPVVRENCFKIYIINKPDNFFETIIQTYSIKDPGLILRWKYFRDQSKFGIIEFDTRSQKYKVLNNKYNIIYDSSKQNKWGPEDYVAYESYFFTGEEYNKLKVFLEEKSDQTIEITPYNKAFDYVYYCKQNKIKVNESKIDNYVERMQQPLISDSVKEDFKKIIYDHAKVLLKIS